MKNLLKWLLRSRFPYKPLIFVEISRSRLLHNLEQYFKIAPQNRIIPALKSNAYGHGIFEVATILEDARSENVRMQEAIPFFAVDSYFEAIALRTKGIRTPLLIIGFTRPEDIISSKLKNISFVVTSLEQLQSISSGHHPIYIHLKIDTGMNRQGLKQDQINQAIQIIKENPNLKLEGLISHFADADNSNQDYTERQISIWNKVVENLQKDFSIKYIHISNTSGHKYTQNINANLSRLGIGLYGFDKNMESIKPVLSMKTIVTSVKNINKGESVGYNCTFTANTDMKIATIPVGYYEGLDRRLSNKGFVKIKDHFCPIIGRMSMNISTIDVSETKDIKIGDEVIVISNKIDDKNSITNISKISQTIEYENLVHIPQHLKRVIVD